MITLNTDKELLIQIHKNQLTKQIPGDTCRIRLTGNLSEKSIEATAAVEALTNCYILSITEPITGIGTNALLEIFDDTQLVFSSESFILESV